jgi:mono/diheme cytochrome c family protein
MKIRTIGLLLTLLPMLVTLLAAYETRDSGWMERVPETEHVQKSPIRKKAAAIAQGRNTFLAHCAQCHGKDAHGSDGAPSLATTRVRHNATEGDLHWLLINGNREHGMPAWAKLGDPQIWQVITYVRSLR